MNRRVVKCFSTLMKLARRSSHEAAKLAGEQDGIHSIDQPAFGRREVRGAGDRSGCARRVKVSKPGEKGGEEELANYGTWMRGRGEVEVGRSRRDQEKNEGATQQVISFSVRGRVCFRTWRKGEGG